MSLAATHDSKKVSSKLGSSSIEANTGSFSSLKHSWTCTDRGEQSVDNETSRLLPTNLEFDIAKIGIQPKLKVSQPDDPYEQEADRAAEQVMRMPAADTAMSHMTMKEKMIHRKCAACEAKEEEEEKSLNIDRKSSHESSWNATDEITSEISNILSSNGSLLDVDAKGFMESRFGYDFSDVRIHSDEKASESANAIKALAYTVGNDIVFGKGQYQPKTSEGRRLLAHELTHVIQRNGQQRQHHNDRLHIDRKEEPEDSSKEAAGQPGQVMEDVTRGCASCASCEVPDVQGADNGDLKWGELTIAVDREEKTLLKAIKSHNVGHTWIKLRDNLGNKYSYGFWPQTGFDADSPGNTVPGCVVHPDVIHDPEGGGSSVEYLDIKYRLDVEQYRAALNYAINTCKSVPNYNLFRFNCTTFAINAAKAAGVSPPHSTTLAIHNPNALARGIIRSKRRMRRRERR